MEQPWTTPAELDSYALKMYREKHPDWIPKQPFLYNVVFIIDNIRFPAHWGARIYNKHLTKQEWEILDKVISLEAKLFAGIRCNYNSRPYLEQIIDSKEFKNFDYTFQRLIQEEFEKIPNPEKKYSEYIF